VPQPAEGKWEDRLNDWFNVRDANDNATYLAHSLQDFIRSELAIAVAEERARIEKIIEGMQDKTDYDEVAEKLGVYVRNRIIIDIIHAIKKP
jgi:hypothetical protein